MHMMYLIVSIGLGPLLCSNIPLISITSSMFVYVRHPCFLYVLIRLHLFYSSSFSSFSFYRSHSVCFLVAGVVSVLFVCIFVKCFSRRPNDRLYDLSAARTVNQMNPNCYQSSPFSSDCSFRPSHRSQNQGRMTN